MRDFRSPDAATRDLAEVSLRRLGDDAVPPLLEVVRTGTEEERYRAVRVLGRMGPAASEAVPDLVKLLTGAELSIPSALAFALAGIGAPAEPAVLPLLASPDETIRYWAVVALGRMTDPGPPALAGMIKALDDPSDPVAAAAEMLLVMQGRRAVPSLQAAALTEDDDAGVRLADILARIRKVEPGIDADPPATATAMTEPSRPSASAAAAPAAEPAATPDSEPVESTGR